MKKIKILVLAMLGVTFAIASCKKDPIQPSTTSDPVDPGDPIETPSGEELRNFFSSNLNNKKQYFTIDASANSSITSAKGASLSFSPNSFVDQNGNVVTGNINLEFIELFDKGEMMMANMPTMANTMNGGIAPLISGGQFKITASQNGASLKLANGYSATIPAPNGVDPNMQIFYGSAGASDTVVWNQADSSMIFGQGNTYNAYFDSLNWVNLDYFMGMSGQQTTVEVEVPQGFTNQNCALLISFDGLNSLGTLYNSNGNVFTSAPGYTLPVGTDVHFIAIAIIGGNPHVAIIPSQITNNHYETISALTQTSDTQLASDLSNLP